MLAVNTLRGVGEKYSLGDIMGENVRAWKLSGKTLYICMSDSESRRMIAGELKSQSIRDRVIGAFFNNFDSRVLSVRVVVVPVSRVELEATAILNRLNF